METASEENVFRDLPLSAEEAPPSLGDEHIPTSSEHISLGEAAEGTENAEANDADQNHDQNKPLTEEQNNQHQQHGATKFRHDTTATRGKCWCGGLSPDVDEATLSSYCSQWGEIADCIVIRLRGFGFVTFREESCATSFLQAPHNINGRRMDVKSAVPKSAAEWNGPSSSLPYGGGGGRGGVASASGSRGPINPNGPHPSKIWVGGLADLESSEVRGYFEQYGNITDVFILRYPDGTPRGFGFVTFDSSESSRRALATGPMHQLKGRSLEVKAAVGQPNPRGERFGGRGLGGLGGGGGGGYGGGGPLRSWMRDEASSHGASSYYGSYGRMGGGQDLYPGYPMGVPAGQGMYGHYPAAQMMAQYGGGGGGGGGGAGYWGGAPGAMAQGGMMPRGPPNGHQGGGGGGGGYGRVPPSSYGAAGPQQRYRPY